MKSLPSNLEILIQNRKKEFSKKLLTWWKNNKRSYPWRAQGVSPYQVLIAEILLKRTTATAASNTFIEFINNYKDIKALAKADIKDLEKILACVGLHRQRAKGLKEIAKFICKKEGCKIPNSLEKLLEVPHIGQYTARAILSFSYNVPVGIVDSNVIRIIKRIFYGKVPKNPSLPLTQAIIDKILPLNKHKEFNLALLDFGALICRYSYPLHGVCPLCNICMLPGKTCRTG